MQALLLSAIKWATFSVACAAPLACELTRFICVVPANGCHLFQMFDINMQRAEACTHKISLQTVVLQPKGTDGGVGGGSAYQIRWSSCWANGVLKFFQPMMWWKGTIAAIKKERKRREERGNKRKGAWRTEECSRWRECAAVGKMSSILLNMHTHSPCLLMGHISLGALCLLPNCKRYLALHL